MPHSSPLQNRNNVSLALNVVRNSRLLAFLASFFLVSFVILIVANLFTTIVLQVVNEDVWYNIYTYGLPVTMGIAFIAMMVIYHKIYVPLSSYRWLREAGVVNGCLFSIFVWTIGNFYVASSRPAWLTSYVESLATVVFSGWILASIITGLILVPLQKYSTSSNI